jgi:hypothetical protein
MASDFEKWVLEETLTAEVADCLVSEAREKIQNASADNLCYNVFEAFANLGMAWRILGDKFEEFRAKLYEETEEVFLSSKFSRKDIGVSAQRGLMFGFAYSLPAKIGIDSIHHGFIARMVVPQLKDRVRYIQGVGWEFLKDGVWHKRPKERGIVGLIYDAMKRKIKTWQEVLLNPLGEGGWLEKLERNINDPEWLSKVEELLLRVDYFGIEIVSGAGERQG